MEERNRMITTTTILRGIMLSDYTQRGILVSD